MRASTRIALALVVLLGPRGIAWSQQPPPRGIQWSALPAVNYDSDNGFGYGVTGGIYRFDGARALYEWSVEPTLFATTGGRRELLATVDIPFLLAGAARLTLFVGFERDCCHPYYGFGNATPYDPALADPTAGVNFYTYTRRRWSLVADMQWRVLPDLRILTGMAAYHNRSAVRDPQTAFALDSASGILATADFRAASVGPKLGVVYDTRDRERDPHRGVWLELLAWRGLGSVLGSSAFTRLGTTARAYVPIRRHLTLAARALGEHVVGDMPTAMLPDVGSSFRDFPGVGGGNTVRGVLRNRYLGRTRVVSNVEVRLRSDVLRVLGQRWRLGAVAFVDAGRVWDERGDDGDGIGLHWGKGGGARIGWGDAFIVALDVAHGAEAGLQMYLGLGHLF